MWVLRHAVALVILARLWWLARRARAAQRDSAIEGEFAVIERREHTQRIDASDPR